MSGDSPGLSRAARKLRLAVGFLRGQPVFCTWQLGRCATPDCVFCEHRLEGGDERASFEDCRKVVEALDGCGSLIVALGGSDPFLHPELDSVVGLIARRHFPLLTTHGWLVNRERARAVWTAGLAEATVVLHDADAQRHDARVGQPGAHARAVNAVRHFAAERTQPTQVVSVRVPLNPDGVGAVERVVGLAAELGAETTVEPPLLGESPELGADLSRQLLELRRRHPSLRGHVGYLARIDEALGVGVGGCRAGRRTLHIDHRGRVSRCPEFRGATDQAGDLRSDDAREVLERLRRLSAADGCRRCWRPFRGEMERLESVWGMLSALPTLVRR